MSSHTRSVHDFIEEAVGQVGEIGSNILRDEQAVDFTPPVTPMETQIQTQTKADSANKGDSLVKTAGA